MNVIQTSIPDVVIFEPKIFGDSRGYFCETFRYETINKFIGHVDFIQDNESKSSYGVLRGLHFQKPPYTQSKLVRVIHGEVLDVVVDVRIGSPTYGKYVAAILSDQNKHQLWAPKGFAHGYCVLSKEAIFYYKVDKYYMPDSDGGIIFNDRELSIDWQVPESKLILSEKDLKLSSFKDEKSFKYGEF
jgi:dTDP-4-dehydrorhamnose 3,5-epimerase